MGTTGGGVFKTTDGGINWQPMTDKYFGGTIGAITVDPKNPDVVWVGGGETCIRGNVSHGDGVWMTKDAGKTWSYMGLKETEQIGAVLIRLVVSATAMVTIDRSRVEIRIMIVIVVAVVTYAYVLLAYPL